MAEQMMKKPPSLRGHKHFDNWLKYHKANRNIIREIMKEMDKLIKAGEKHLSVKHILIVLRHRHTISVDRSSTEYKINDAFTSIYARIIAYNWPRYARYIETRKLTSIQSSK